MFVRSLHPVESNAGAAGAARRAEAVPRRGFTLIELMIAIVILGLGLTMVATIFPVAWTRAKAMSEVTAQQTMVPTIESTLRSLVPVADKSLTRVGFAGDLVYADECSPGWIAAYSDTRVHALNLNNLKVQDRAFVAEDPWRLEMMPDARTWVADPLVGDPLSNSCNELYERIRGLNLGVGAYVDMILEPFSYHTPRVDFGQRLYPPLPPRDPNTVDTAGKFTGDDPSWDGRFDTRRFAWAVFHRLRKRVGPVPPTSLVPPNDYRPGDPIYVQRAQEASSAAGEERTFDIYYVTLRRTRPTDRYARQEASFVPNPNILAATAGATPVPQAMLKTDDVLLPTPWRVQIEVPQFPAIQLADDATGLPTEVLIPPNNFPGGEQSKIMLVQMFPPGTFFIDEINGQVYKVVQRRIVDDVGGEAVLTLDREITLEDVDIPETSPGVCDVRFPTFGACTVVGPNHALADPEELLRTVWVFPPATGQRDDSELFPTFDGPGPIVGVDVRSLSLLP